MGDTEKRMLEMRISQIPGIDCNGNTQIKAGDLPALPDTSSQMFLSAQTYRRAPRRHARHQLLSAQDYRESLPVGSVRKLFPLHPVQPRLQAKAAASLDGASIWVLQNARFAMFILLDMTFLPAGPPRETHCAPRLSLEARVAHGLRAHG